jgi:hypothetical protein
MEKALSHVLVLVQGAPDETDFEAIEGHCRAALATAWGCHADEVSTPDLEEIKAIGREDQS